MRLLFAWLCLGGTLVSAQEFIPQLSIFSPTIITLESFKNQTDFQDNISGIPVVSVNLSQYLASRAGLQFHLREKLSYFYKQFLTNTRDSLRIHGLTTQVACDVRYPTRFAFEPGFTLGLGGSWIYQNSIEADRAFYVPYVSLGPTFIFFAAERSSAESFQGISFVIEYAHSFLTHYDYRGMFFNIGVHFAI